MGILSIDGNNDDYTMNQIWRSYIETLPYSVLATIEKINRGNCGCISKDFCYFAKLVSLTKRLVTCVCNFPGLFAEKYNHN